MTNLKLFDLIPNGVIVFKEHKIQYINQHLLDILNVTFLDMHSAINIVLKTMNMKNDEEFFSYCNSNDYIIRKEKIIQIAHKSYGEYDIFSFMLIYPSLVSIDLGKKNIEESKAVNIDEKIAKFFKLKDIKRVQVLTFYKGLPLKNIGNITKISKEFIEIEADGKHHISLLNSDDIILITDTKKSASALHGHVIQNKDNLFRISNFVLSKDGKHLREEIRIKTFDDMQAVIDEEEYVIYDISHKGISINIQDQIQETLLKKKASMKIIFNNETLALDIKYLKTIYDGDKILKIIFLIFPPNKTASIIHDYLTKKQNELIREIHKFQNS